MNTIGIATHKNPTLVSPKLLILEPGISHFWKLSCSLYNVRSSCPVMSFVQDTYILYIVVLISTISYVFYFNITKHHSHLLRHHLQQCCLSLVLISTICQQLKFLYSSGIFSCVDIVDVNICCCGNVAHLYCTSILCVDIDHNVSISFHYCDTH